MDDKIYVHGLIERKCAYCGRKFIPAAYHSYKFGYRNQTKWFCKYTCMVKYREEHKPSKREEKANERI